MRFAYLIRIPISNNQFGAQLDRISEKPFSYSFRFVQGSSGTHGCTKRYHLLSDLLTKIDKEKEKKKEQQKEVTPAETSQDMHSAILASIPQFASYGVLFNSSKPVELTESELEYVVTCVKHVFPEHIVLQVSVWIAAAYSVVQCEEHTRAASARKCGT